MSDPLDFGYGYTADISQPPAPPPGRDFWENIFTHRETDESVKQNKARKDCMAMRDGIRAYQEIKNGA